MSKGEGRICVTHGAKVKQCSFEDCRSNTRKVGLCYRHGSKSFNAINNPTLQPNADFTPINDPPYQSTNYEDEEEFDSWIWRSNAHMTGHGA